MAQSLQSPNDAHLAAFVDPLPLPPTCWRCSGSWAFDDVLPRCLNCGNRAIIKPSATGGPVVEDSQPSEAIMTGRKGPGRPAKSKNIPRGDRPRGRPKKARESQGDLGKYTGSNSRSLEEKVNGSAPLTPLPAIGTTPTTLQEVPPIPVEDEPLVRFCLKRWNELDAKIQALREEQAYLENFCQEFRDWIEAGRP